MNARKAIKMDKEAAASGRASFSLDGKMVDIPVIVRAEKLIRRYEAIKAREADACSDAKLMSIVSKNERAGCVKTAAITRECPDREIEREHEHTMHQLALVCGSRSSDAGPNNARATR